MRRPHELPSWPSDRSGGAVEQLAMHLGTIDAPVSEDPSPDASTAKWLPQAAARVGLDADPVAGWSDDPRRVLRRLAPGVIVHTAGTLAIVEASPFTVRVLGPDGRIHRTRTRTVAKSLSKPARDAVADEVEDLLTAVGDRGTRTRQAVLRTRLRSRSFDGAWALRPGPGTPLRSSVRSVGLLGRVSAFAFAELLGYVAFVVSWAVLGRAALSGRIEGGALVLWALLLTLSVGLRLTARWLEGVVGINAGRLLRRRVLVGALQADLDDIRHQGVGQLTGRVLETQVVEDAAVGGGLLAAMGAAELVLAAVVLTRGAAPLALPVLLAGWTVVMVIAGRRYLVAARAWTAGRLALTNTVVDLIVGHRTRLVQCPPSQWHDGELAAVATYERSMRRLDRDRLRVGVLVARGWMLTSLVVLSISGGTQAGFAVAFGGILLAFHSLTRSATALVQLADVAVAARQMTLFLDAAARDAQRPASRTTTTDASPRAALVGAGLWFRRPGRDLPALSACDLDVRPGARILLEGPSGAGKSTLAAVLSGLLVPSSGRLELGGRDIDEVGAQEWRRRVSLSPQFHENHLMLGSLGFNLLLGRRWPPTPTDLQDAWVLCERLGLGPVLERMPSGLEEIVGDCGWQLSEGERSLVYVARSLLQRPDVVLLDESFGSLDPVTLAAALPTVVEASPALVVIRQ